MYYYNDIKMEEITKICKNDGVKFIVIVKEQTKSDKKTGLFCYNYLCFYNYYYFFPNINVIINFINI